VGGIRGKNKKKNIFFLSPVPCPLSPEGGRGEKGNRG